MPKKVTTVSGKAGALPADRRIFASVSSTTNAPTEKDDGYLLNRNEFIHFLFAVGGTNPSFRLRIHWYSFISQRWHRGEVLTVNADDLVTVEVQGLNRVELEVTQVKGTLPTLDAWLALVKPV